MTISGCQAPQDFCLRASRLTLEIGKAAELNAGHVDMLYECDRPASVNVRWSVVDTSIARVELGDTVRAHSIGTTEIVARSRRTEKRIALTVIPTVARVDVSPKDTTITVGDTVIFRGVAYGVDGNAMPGVNVIVGPAGVFVPTPWLFPVSHINPGLAPPNGVAVVGRQPGSTFIVGIAGDRRDSVPVKIQP